jgi:hypothetical protein
MQTILFFVSEVNLYQFSPAANGNSSASRSIVASIDEGGRWQVSCEMVGGVCTCMPGPDLDLASISNLNCRS